MDYNELGSTGYRYSSNPFQYGKGMVSSSSVPHDRTDAYKASIFSGFVASPPPVGSTTFSFLLLSFPSPYVSVLFTSLVKWTVTFLHLCAGLESDIVGLPYSSVPP